MLADKIISFLQSLHLDNLPKGVDVMNPYQDEKAFALCKTFYKTFYSDTHKRVVILGINPGRFGGGVTGIPFTDPVKLETYCNIANDYPKRTELSADFIYRMIEAFGGVHKFYGKFFFSAVSPLGFTKDNKNLNYYDVPALQQRVEPFAVQCLEKQFEFPVSRNICFCLGEGKNFSYMQKLNERYHFFQKIIPLPHPRFVMQYKRKKIQEYVAMYLDNFTAI